MLSETRSLIKQCIYLIRHPNLLRSRLFDLWLNKITRKPMWYSDKYGITCRIYPSSNVRWIFKGNSHFDDPGIINVLNRVLKPGMKVFDVGANKGAFSLYAAKLVAPNGDVHAFEPGQVAFERLRENVDFNKQVKQMISIHQLAVSDVNSTVEFKVFPPEYSEWNTLGMPSALLTKSARISDVNVEIVSCVTLDQFCEENLITDIDLLKIDVEGFETNVIQGAANLLDQHKIKMLIFEISLDPLVAANKTAVDVFESVAKHKFQIFQIMADGQLVPIHDIKSFDIPRFSNYLAIPMVN